jgi:hypothetical protein
MSPTIIFDMDQGSDYGEIQYGEYIGEDMGVALFGPIKPKKKKKKLKPAIRVELPLEELQGEESNL